MAHYILVETRDPMSSGDVSRFVDLAAQLSRKGDRITFVLTENGVLGTRKNIPNNPLDALPEDVALRAESFSLRERGIREVDRHPRVASIEIDDLVSSVMANDGTRVIWHR